MKNFELIEVLNVFYVFFWIKIKNWMEICVNLFFFGFDFDLLKNKIIILLLYFIMKIKMRKSINV